jgi:hypothetical protein
MAKKLSCKKCGVSEKDTLLFMPYVDGNNISITKYSPWFCGECLRIMETSNFLNPPYVEEKTDLQNEG